MTINVILSGLIGLSDDNPACIGDRASLCPFYCTTFSPYFFLGSLVSNRSCSRQCNPNRFGLFLFWSDLFGYLHRLFCCLVNTPSPSHHVQRLHPTSLCLSLVLPSALLRVQLPGPRRDKRGEGGADWCTSAN